ncbi:MAG: hypothetical protein ACOYLS_01455 [Polymorphobacter sp.]
MTPRYTGPVLVDPANDRPGIRNDYAALHDGAHAAAKAPAFYRPWAATPPRAPRALPRLLPRPRADRPRRRAATACAFILLLALFVAASWA